MYKIITHSYYYATNLFLFASIYMSNKVKIINEMILGNKK
jgi:hypothetical protein